MTEQDGSQSRYISDEYAEKIIRAPKYIRSLKDINNMKVSSDESYLTNDVSLECEYPCCIKVRQTIARPLNFSVVLTYIGDGNKVAIVRYNGNHGTHVNRLTKERINGPHIHYITEEYQSKTTHPDGYAVATTKYCDLNSAIVAFVEDMNITVKGPDKVKKLEEY